MLKTQHPDEALADDNEPSISRPALARRLIVFGAVYFAGALLGRSLTFHPGSFVGFWPPSGLFMIALLMNKHRHWPAFVLTALAANLGFDLFNHQTAPVSLLFFLGNSLEALTGAWLLDRYVIGRIPHWPLHRIAGGVVLSAAVSAAVSATIGAETTMHISTAHSFTTNWLLWWSADMMGIMLFVPLRVLWMLEKLLTRPATPARPFGALASLRPTARQNLTSAACLLGAGLIITVIFALNAKRETEQDAQREFDFLCNEIQIRIQNRISTCAQLLNSGAALFEGSETVERREWQAFTRRLQMSGNLPGIQGLGFSLLIPRAQLVRHVQEIRSEGFPDYQVIPAGERELYSSIIYLEPFADRNLRAFGYDMWSEPVRRAAMERARDGNEAALSGKVILKQETEIDQQAGTLMYVPVYRHGLPIETIEQRRLAIQGWVYSPYRMTDLIRDTLRDMTPEASRISLQIHDGTVISAETLIYDSRTEKEKSATSHVRLTRLTPVKLAGHRWTLRFTQLWHKSHLAEFHQARLVLFSGLCINLLVFGLLLSLITLRSHAQRLAEQLTKDLRESDENHRRLIEHSQDIIYTLNVKGVFLFVSSAWTTLLGHSVTQVVGQSFPPFVHPDDLAGYTAFHRKVIESGQPRSGFELRLKHLDGSWRWHASSAVPLKDAAGTVVGLDGMSRDITLLKQVEEITQRASVDKLNFLALLQESEKRFRAFIEQAGDGFELLDEQGRLLDANTATLQQLGYTKDELIRLNLADIDPMHNGRTFTDMFATLKNGAPLTFESMHRRKNGTTYPVEITASLVHLGESCQCMILARDITARKKIEADNARQLDELRRWSDITLGRETRILALKREVNAAQALAGLPPHYATADESPAGNGK